jgi:hypothetical protein
LFTLSFNNPVDTKRKNSLFFHFPPFISKKRKKKKNPSIPSVYRVVQLSSEETNISLFFNFPPFFQKRVNNFFFFKDKTKERKNLSQKTCSEYSLVQFSSVEAKPKTSLVFHFPPFSQPPNRERSKNRYKKKFKKIRK